MTDQFTFIPNIDDLIEAIQPDSITSRTFYKGDGLNAILFAFDAGQELSEHTSSKSAIIQVIKGEGRITLGEESYQAQVGTWIQMPAHLKHSVYAESPLIMLLLMFNSA